jgi:hypothetical protein
MTTLVVSMSRGYDAGYSGKLVEKIKTAFAIEVQIVEKNETEKFAVLPKRWIV